MAAIYMAVVLLVSLLAGALILELFGISLPALRIAGGLVIARIGFSMLNPEPEEKLPEEDQKEALDKRDVAFTPIAMPMLSGPGSIAVTISMATSVDRPVDYVAVGIGILIVAVPVLAGPAFINANRRLPRQHRGKCVDTPDGADYWFVSASSLSQQVFLNSLPTRQIVKAIYESLPGLSRAHD